MYFGEKQRMRVQVYGDGSPRIVEHNQNQFFTSSRLFGYLYFLSEYATIAKVAPIKLEICLCIKEKVFQRNRTSITPNLPQNLQHFLSWQGEWTEEKENAPFMILLLGIH